MHQLLDSDLDRHEAASHGDREISLGAGTILGLFFGLAIICGAFFGLGYSTGRHSAQNAPSAVIVSNSSPALSSGAKPTAGSSGAKLAPEHVDSIPDPAPAPPVAQNKATAADGAIVGDKLAVRTPAPVPSSSAAPSAAAALPAIAADGTFMVQVAAVSSKDIAEIELAALRKYNYSVVVRHEPQDQLLHIQIGPFATKKDAEAMRQNVLSHGFNAIVK